MGLLVEFLSFILISTCAGLSYWVDKAYFDKDWQEALAVGSAVFCGSSGVFCFIWGIIMMCMG